MVFSSRFYVKTEKKIRLLIAGRGLQTDSRISRVSVEKSFTQLGHLQIIVRQLGGSKKIYLLAIAIKSV